MAKTTSFEIKFEGYEKTFKNIDAITSELADMNQELKELEKQFNETDPDENIEKWKELAEQINFAEKQIKNFTQSVEKSVEETNKALQSSIETQKELDKQAEETRKALNEAFSPEAIIEFSAKASAAFIGLSEAFGGTGGAAEKSIERIQRALITVNALKDSAEVAVLSFRKFDSVLGNWSASLAKGGKSASLLGKGVDLLGKGLKSPLFILTAIIGVVTALTSAFGSLANVINFVSDSVSGLVKGFKALVSFENPFTAFNNEFDRLGKQRGFEKLFQDFQIEVADTSKALANLNKQLELSNSFGEKRQLTNEIFEISNDLIKKEINLLKDLASVETDKSKLDELTIQRRAKEVELVQLSTQNVLDNRQITLDSIASITEALTIQGSTKVRLLEQELLFTTGNAKKSEELINKQLEADTKAAKFRIANLEALGFKDEAITNEIAALKEEVEQKELSAQNRIRAIKLNSAELERQTLNAIQTLKIQQNEKDLQFIDIRTQKGLEEAEKLIKATQELRENEVKISLQSLKDLGENATEEEKIRIITIENELKQIKIDSDNQIKDTKLANIDLVANSELTQIELNAKQREKEAQKAQVFANEETRLIELNTEKLQKRAQSFDTIFNRASIYRELENDISKQTQIQFETLQKERDLQLASLNDQRKVLEIEKQRIIGKKDINQLTAEEKQQIEQIQGDIDVLNGSEIKIKVEFQTNVGKNEVEDLSKKRELRKQRIEQANEEFQAIAQTAADVGNLLLDAQLAFLDNKLEIINEKRAQIDESINQLNEDIADSQSEIDRLKGRIEEQKAGSAAKSFFQSSLEKELALREQLEQKVKEEEKSKLALAQEEKRIADQQAKIAKTQAIIQAALSAAQFIGAIASTAASSGPSSPITVPIVLGTIAAGIAAVGAFTKLEEGGLIAGPSHDKGGVKGTGAFNNIEVEGDEFVINKKATKNNLPLIENINRFGAFRKFSNGGQLAPSQDALQGAQSSNAGSQINKILNQPTYLSVVEFEKVKRSVTVIESKSKIG